MTLVSTIIALFSNNSVAVELGIDDHLGIDVIASWMETASKLKVLDFLDDVDAVMDY